MKGVARVRRNYLIGTLIMWTAVIAASAMILDGTPYFARMLPILGGATAWFVVIVPGGLLKDR